MRGNDGWEVGIRATIKHRGGEWGRDIIMDLARGLAWEGVTRYRGDLWGVEPVRIVDA